MGDDKENTPFRKPKAEAFVDTMTGRFYADGTEKQKTSAGVETCKKVQTFVKLKSRKQRGRGKEKLLKEKIRKKKKHQRNHR